MKRKMGFVSTVLMVCFFFGCASAPKISSLKPAEFRSLSVKVYSADYHDVFISSIKALESIGFKIKSAYESTGTIETYQKGSNPFLLIFWGGCPRPYYEVALNRLKEGGIEVVVNYYAIWEDVTRMQCDNTAQLSSMDYQKKIDRFTHQMEICLNERAK